MLFDPAFRCISFFLGMELQTSIYGHGQLPTRKSVVSLSTQQYPVSDAKTCAL